MARCSWKGHSVLSKTQLLAMPRGLPAEGLCQHTMWVRPRALPRGKHFCKVDRKSSRAQ